MPELFYWIIISLIFIFTLPLIFFLGIISALLLIGVVAIATILWIFDLKNIQIYEIKLDFTILFFLIIISFASIFFFTALIGFFISKYKKQSHENVNIANEKKTVSGYSKLFFKSMFDYIYDTKWIFFFLTPVSIIFILLISNEFTPNDLWI
tara:strand:- start:114 stop:569 length:456 start_codon:yes stop_codon:yes gene_type:complete